MKNEDLKRIEKNIEEARHYSRRAFMKVSEYGLWLMTTWTYYEAKKKDEITPLVKALRIVGCMGVLAGCALDIAYDVKAISKLEDD